MHMLVMLLGGNFKGTWPDLLNHTLLQLAYANARMRFSDVYVACEMLLAFPKVTITRCRCNIAEACLYSPIGTQRGLPAATSEDDLNCTANNTEKWKSSVGLHTNCNYTTQKCTAITFMPISAGLPGATELALELVG